MVVALLVALLLFLVPASSCSRSAALPADCGQCLSATGMADLSML